MTPAMRKALFSLAILAVFGAVIAYLSVAAPTAKEFVGTIAGGIVSVAALVYAASSRDEAREGKAAGERAEREARAGYESARVAEAEGRAAREAAERGEAEGKAAREAGERAEQLAAVTDRDKRKAQRRQRVRRPQ